MKDKKETTLLPLTNDLVFRVVYGRDTPECKEALATMLNLIMGEKERPITELSYENPITLSENIDIKGTEMDIKVSIRTRELVDTEMQVRVGSSYAKRAVFYDAQLLTTALGRGEDYDALDRAVVVSLLRGRLFKETQKVHTVFQYYEREEHFLLTDISELHFVELGKIDLAKPVEEMSPLEQYGAYLLSAGVQGAEELLSQLLRTGNEVIRLTHEVLKTVSEEQLLREAARSRENWQRMQKTFENEARRAGLQEGIQKGRWEGLQEGMQKGRQEGLQKGRQEGLQEGLQEGRQEGLQQKAKEIALALKKKHLAEEEISLITGLPVEEIARL